jgi:co-chaperonin GroES (HSP10)
MTMTEIATPNKEIVSPTGKVITSDAAQLKKDAAELAEAKAEASSEEAAKALQLPHVKGYRILCAVPEVGESYESGIIKSDKTRNIEEHSTVVLFVMKMGDMAYADKDRFPTGAWCKEGDFVIARAYSGTRIKIHGKEFRIINDDTVEAVVDDPRGYERA